MSLDESQRLACLEIASVSGGEFEAVHRFLESPGSERVLALEALFRSLRDLPLTVSDMSVALAKLGWWQQELSRWVMNRQARETQEGSQHPVIQSLVRSGGAARLRDVHLTPYLLSIAEQIQRDATATLVDLKSWLDETMGREARMLWETGDHESRLLANAASSARLLELIRGLGTSGLENRWLPMDLVARHQYVRNADVHAPGSVGLIKELAGAALDWQKGLFEGISDPVTTEGRYMLLRSALVRRRLNKIARQPRAVLERQPVLRPSDVWTVWRAARKIRPCA